MAKKIRGVMMEENLNNTMGLHFYNLSHRFGHRHQREQLVRHQAEHAEGDADRNRENDQGNQAEENDSDQRPASDSRSTSDTA